jgi:hypothetical protein
MDRKIPNIYNTNYSARNMTYRNDTPFQNMVIRQNNIIPMGPMPNIVLVDTNFLNRKREGQDISANNVFTPNDNFKSKY